MLERRLTEVLEAKNVGLCGGRLTIPEITTLIFYGSDAESLFQVLERSTANQL
jgi:hypothetical protein